MTPYEVAQAGFWLTLQQAAIAVIMYTVLVFVLLRIANYLSGFEVDDVLDRIQEQDPRGMAIYLSVRYAVHGLGIAMILASVFQYA